MVALFEIFRCRWYRPEFSSKMRYRLEYFPVWLLATFIGALPRPLARFLCQGLAMLVYALHGRLRRVGMRNLDLAFPAKSRKEKNRSYATCLPVWDGSWRNSACFRDTQKKMFPGLRSMTDLRISPRPGREAKACCFLLRILADGRLVRLSTL